VVKILGIIPCAGKAERIGGKCKPLLMINGKYIIETIFENMMNVGIKEIYIIVNGEEIEKTCGYNYYGVKLNYIQQPKQDGLSEAIKLCRDLKESMLIILGDIIYKGNDLKDIIKVFEESLGSAVLTYKKEEDFKEIQKSFGFTEKWPMITIEKPQTKDKKILRNYLGLGIFIITPEIIDFIGKEPFTETFNKFKTITLIQELKGKYFNINTEEDLANANSNTI